MTTFETITLAALLHDIGKFSQFASIDLDDIEPYKIQEICPNHAEKSNQFHVLHSISFIKNYLKSKNNKLIELVAYHHAPEKAPSELQPDAKLLALADWLSNGEYRGKEVEMASEAISQPLISIFSKIVLNGKSHENHYIPPTILDLNLRNLFPVSNAEETIKSAKHSFKELWENFINEFLNIEKSSNFITTFLYLLEKYTLTVPSLSETGEHHISLYHHLKSTAAIAACLANLDQTQVEQAYSAIATNELTDEILEETACYLIGGDLSGIQDFIYSVTSEHALKGLRGRSFYLQLITESVAKSILSLFNLTVTNILYTGGGHFFILIPAKTEMESQLNFVKNAIDQILLKAHRGKLALAISEQKLSWQDFFGNRFGKAFHTLKQNLAIAKRRKFSSFFTDETNMEQIMGPYDIGGEKAVCEICSEEIKDDSQTNQCKFCQSFIKLAYELSQANYVVEKKLGESFKSLQEKPFTYEKVIRQFGYQYHFEREIKKTQDSYLINSTAFLTGPTSCTGFHFFPKYAPTKKNGSIKMLEDLAGEATGLQAWGVFRADVDHLGEIFKNGLGAKQSITEISMLSYFVSLFFSAQVEYIAKEDFSEQIYIIYSGGDDMFALGPWSLLPDFGQKLHDDFRKFTCQHPAITISGGIYLSPSKKFPVYQAADSAGESLEKAKNEGRHKITFFEKAITWDDLRDVNELKAKLAKLLGLSDDVLEDSALSNKKKVPRSLLQILYAGWADKESEAVKKGTSIFKIWRLLYAFKRLKERHKNFISELTDLEDAIIKDYQLKPNLDVALRWAEYLTRNIGGSNND